MIFALNAQLDKMFVEGLDQRFQRHIDMAEYIRDWGRKHFAVFPDEKYLSNTLTTITNTTGFSVADMNKELGKRGGMISNGYGKLKEKTFRIAHMGDLTLEDMKWLTAQIEDILKLS